MIISATRISAASGAGALWRHLNKTSENSSVEVIEGTEAELNSWIADARALDRKHGLRHVQISPDSEITDGQAREIAADYAAEFGGDADHLVLVRHEKARVDNPGVRHHWHAVLPEVSPKHARTLDSSHSFARHEWLSRLSEWRLGENIQVGNFMAGVIDRARRAFGADSEFAQACQDAKLAKSWAPAYSRDEHQRGKRLGRPLPEVKSAIKDAYLAAEDVDGFLADLSDRGLELRGGEKPGVWMVHDAESGAALVAAHRCSGIRKRDFAAFIESGPPLDPESGPEAAIEEAPDAPRL